MRTGSTPAKSRTILCMRAVPGMARGVRRRLLPQPSRLGRRRIVLTGPSLPSPLLLSGLQSCRRLVRRHQNRDRRPLWVIGLPCQTRGRSLRQADYPQLPRSTHPTTNLAATSSPLSCDDFIEYAHFQTVIDNRIGAPGSPAKMPFRATNAANWSSIIRIGAKMAVIRRRIARRAVSSHTQRAGRVPYGESRLTSGAATARQCANGLFTPSAASSRPSRRRPQAPVTPATEPERRAGGSLTTGRCHRRSPAASR